MAGMEGIERLNRKLSRLPDATKKLMRDALEKNAKELVEAQKALAAPHRRSGRTIESIQIGPGEHELQVKVFSDDFAARWEEFGTVKTAAIPFFFPPYRLLRKKFVSRTRSGISKAVKVTVSVG